jgi:hypothetical protein
MDEEVDRGEGCWMSWYADEKNRSFSLTSSFIRSFCWLTTRDAASMRALAVRNDRRNMNSRREARSN